MFRTIERAGALALAISLLVPARAEALRITEFLALNDGIVVDEDGDPSDWLELYNETAGDVDLDGYYLTDDEDDLVQWRLPSVVMAPGQYLLVWASGKDRSVAGAPLHTNFRLSGSGEYLALVQPDGATIEHDYAPEFPEQDNDISYGLAADFLTRRCFLDPTPGAANDTSRPCGQVADVEFSVERGFFDAPLSVSLSTPTAGAVIRYTTDASTPTEVHGAIYAGPIAVDTTTALRAAAFAPELLPAPAITHTYIFPADVIRQNEADLVPPYPTHWTGGTGADYDMDPEVVDDPAYAATIVEDLKTIPTMSLVTDIDNFFGATEGIYTHVQGRGVAWERPVSMEIVYPDGRPGTQINCGVRMQGDLSRSSSAKKHSMRLLFKSIYGPSKLEFPLFPGNPVEKFDTVTLTATHNNSWHAGYSRTQYIRDSWAKDTQLAMGRPGAHTTYVHLYLNGMYWGLYRPTERPDASFLAEHLGGDKEEYDAWKSGELIDGEPEAWKQAHDLARGPLTDPADVAAFYDLVDVDNLIDYMLVNFYAGNFDWDFKNWYAGRRRAPGEKFRFFSWDAELIFGTLNSNRTAPANFEAPSAFYGNLRAKLPEFRARFADRAWKHLTGDGALTPAPVAERWMRRATEIDRAVVGESARWGDKSRGVPYTRDIDWLIEQQRLLLAYFPARTRVVIEQLRRKGLFPEIDAPVLEPAGGDFLPGQELSMTTAAGTIYYTDDGSDPRLEGGAVSPVAMVYSGALVLTDGVVVTARALDGVRWSAPVEAAFVPESPVRITELMYHPSDALDVEYLELANVGPVPVSLDGYAFTEGVSLVLGAGTLAPGEHAVVTEDAVAFAAAFPGVRILGEYSGGLSNGGEQVRLEDALGNEVFDFRYDDGWYLSTDGDGPAMVVRDPSGDRALLSAAEGWRAGAVDDGTPGIAEPAICADGVDNDGDGFTDFPADAGCADADADEEAPVCDDGIDNDGDGDVDLADADCLDASGASEATDSGDAYHCYRTLESSTSLTADDPGVLLDDTISDAAHHALRKSRAVCLPASVAGSSVADATTALLAVDARPIEAAGVVPQLGLDVTTAFGRIFLDASAPDRLMLPAALDVGVTPDAPVDGTHRLDAFHCYRVRLSKAAPRYFPRGATGHVADDLEARDYGFKPPKRLCLATSVDDEPVLQPDRHLLCYPSQRASHEPRHVALTDLRATAAPMAIAAETRVEEELCLPATVVFGP